MSVTNGVIQASVRLQADIMAALGLTSPKVGYLLGNSHGKITPWAKYKPTRWSYGFPRSSAAPYNCIVVEGREYWQANDGLCGFNIPIISRAGLTSDSLTASDWSYLPPRGGASEPYYMGMMIGYNTAAGVPYTVEFPSGNAYIGETADVLFFDQARTNQLTLPEILKTFGTAYIGVMVESGSTTRFYTSGNILSGNFGGNFGISITLPVASNKCTLFLTNQAASGGTLASAALVYPFYSGVTRQATVTAVNRPTYRDSYKISSWTSVECGYNYIRFTAVLANSGNGGGSSIAIRDLYLWYSIRDEYNTPYVANRLKYWNSQPSTEIWKVGEARTFTIYFDDITTIRNWEGSFGLDYSSNGTTFDALGGYEVTYP